VAQRDPFQQQRNSGSGSVRTSRSAALVGIAMRAVYRYAFETTTEIRAD
jgi:hypothetical protein